VADEDRKWTLGDFSRVEKKKRELGIESLTDEEREILRVGQEFADRFFSKLPPGYLDEMKRTIGAYARMKDTYEALPPEDQMRYGDWSVAHLEVFLPLIAERAASDEDDA
jgi:hypothetical protein